ncbi:ABC transporter substrate-binding protein [Virgibacillus oceani]
MKQLKYFLVMLTIVILLAACGDAEETDVSEENQDVQTEDQAGEASENTDEAKEETALEETGELVLYTSGPGGMAEQLVEAFMEETDIEVDMYQATTGQVLGRLEAEQSNPIADVVVLASLPAAMDYADQGLIYPYESEYAGQMRTGWYDEDFHYYGFSGSAVGLSYNTDLVEEPPADWADLLDESYQDSIAIPDPSQSGTALDFISAYENQYGDEAWELFSNLKDNGLILEGANRPALDSVISGANKVVMGGVDYMVHSSQADGEPVDIVFPSSGTMITPRPAFILESAQNLDAAQKYIDFILSDKGQEIVADAYLIPGREDVSTHTDRAPIEEIEVLDYDWNYLIENSESTLQEFTELVR